MQSKLSSIILVVSASLSLAAIGIIPIYHQASAKKECSNNDDSGGSDCSDKQDSDSNSNDDNNKHSSDDGSSAKKDKTPFVLSTPVPFP